MSSIHLLSEQVWNRIAAGEVVERPASVVKELVENSLDAGATRIRISVEDAGRKLISVQDNGCGMDEDDAMLCFESHATSKIRTEEDIFAIDSFGFRGEAIPSIASVSKMSIRTRQKENNSGFEVVVHGGKSIAANPAGCAPGTEVSIRDLFYNHPARKKFLRSAATEERHITECITNIALAHPETAFELRIDGRTVISAPGCNDLLQRIRELFGKNCSDALIPVEADNAIRVTGFISNRDYTKATRSEQRVFVNARPVESLSVYRGIRDGFGPMPDKGRYPVAILFLTINPGMVDVNVHPAKREVRFRDDFAVTAAVRSAVTAALRKADQVIPYHPSAPHIPAAAQSPAADWRKPEPPGNTTVRSLYPDYRPDQIPQDSSAQISELELVMKQALVDYRVQTPQQEQPELDMLTKLLRQDGGRMEENKQASTPVEYFKPQQTAGTLKQMPDILPFPPDSVRNFPNASPAEGQIYFDSYKLKLLGVMENSYIIGVIANGLILIDQHAAHERVLFEKILKGTNGSLSQRLLFPLTLELSRSDMHFVCKNLKGFEDAGFEIDPFGEHTIKLNAIPAALSQNNAGGVFTDMLSRLLERGSAQQLPVHAIATAACKAAVKAHDRLTLEECDALVRDLGKCELPFSCPHGRPTVLNISLNEIEHRFGRK